MFRKQGAAPQRKSSRSGRGRRAHTHFLHSSARARARRRKIGAPTARSGTLLRSQTSFLLFGTKFPFLKKKGGWGRKEKVSNSVFAPPSKNKGEGNNTPKAAPARGPRGCADGAGGGAGRPLSAGSRGRGLGEVGNPMRAGAGCRRRRPPFSNPKRQEGGKTAKKGGKAQIRLGEEGQTRPQTEEEAVRRLSLRGGRARRSSQDCPEVRVAGEADRGAEIRSKNE